MKGWNLSRYPRLFGLAWGHLCQVGADLVSDALGLVQWSIRENILLTTCAATFSKFFNSTSRCTQQLSTDSKLQFPSLSGLWVLFERWSPLIIVSTSFSWPSHKNRFYNQLTQVFSLLISTRIRWLDVYALIGLNHSKSQFWILGSSQVNYSESKPTVFQMNHSWSADRHCPST